MPGLLNPTNAVPGYDTGPVRVTVPPQAGEAAVQNVINPHQVVRPDGRSDRQDNNADAQLTRYESNFMTFVLRLREAPDMATEFLQLLQGGGLYVSSGIQSGFAEELSQLLDFLNMNESELLSFLQNQFESSSRFSGPLFQALRNAYNSSGMSPSVQNDILQFLRKYSDYSSSSHLEAKILREVADMADSVPSRWASQLTDILGELENSISAGDREGALKQLRDQVFPLISQYVSRTHDHGAARSLLSTLALDVARYENGSREGMLLSLRHLSAIGVLPEKLNELSDDELMELFKDTPFLKASRDNAFADRLTSLTHQALLGKGGAQTQEAFRNILSSMLINESVYMPLNHIMLPLNYDGRNLFSEMWVDPDSHEQGQRSTDPPGIRLLLKMDIQDVGAFDLLLDARDTNVSLSVACPPSVAPFSDEVSDALAGILTRNGLTPGIVNVQEMRRPIAISEAFPKIFERGHGVDVQV